MEGVKIRAMNMQQEKLQAEDMVFELLSELGNLYLELGKYDKAIEKLKALVDLGETEAAVFKNLSKAYLLKKQVDEEAREIFEKTIELEPDNTELNQVLSEIYLAEEKTDEKALNVFQKVFKKNPEKLIDISRKLIHESIKNKNHEKIWNHLSAFKTESDHLDQLLKIYMLESWENSAYDEVASYLNELMKDDQSLNLHQWYIVNLVKKISGSDTGIEISHEDFEIFQKYIESDVSFISLDDLYYYLTASRVFNKIPVKFTEDKKPSIEEYELFLGDDSFTNIWDMGLNKQNSKLNIQPEKNLKIWEKLNLIDDAHKTEKENFIRQTKVKDIYNRANSLLILKSNKKITNEITDTLLKTITKISGKKNAYIQGFSTDNGYVIFWENINSLVSVAENFLKDFSSGDSNNLFQFEIVVQDISLSRNSEARYLIDDLEISLSVLCPSQEIDLAKSESKGKKGHQLLISSSVKNLIEEERSDSIVPSEISIIHPVTEDKIPVFNLCWNDAIKKIVNGEIKTVGKFSISKELHPNQVFTSYKAVDSMLERFVVLKVLKPGFEIQNAKKNVKKAFLEQARNMGKLTHPNISLIYEVGEDQDLNFLAREFIEGEPLKPPREINKKLNWKQAVNWCIQISEILLFTHNKNIIHGRLKPSNIFTISKSEVKLTDFQIPGFSLPAKKLENASAESLTYFAPELINDNELSFQTDIFALGVILYELLTDINPFMHQKPNKIFDQIQTKTPESISNYNKNVPNKLNNIVLKMIEKTPVKRYKRMKDLLADLKEILKAE